MSAFVSVVVWKLEKMDVFSGIVNKLTTKYDATFRGVYPSILLYVLNILSFILTIGSHMETLALSFSNLLPTKLLNALWSFSSRFMISSLLEIGTPFVEIMYIKGDSLRNGFPLEFWKDSCGHGTY